MTKLCISELPGATGLGLQYSTFITGQVEIYLTLYSSAHVAFLHISTVFSFPAFRMQKPTATEVPEKKIEKIFSHILFYLTVPSSVSLSAPCGVLWMKGERENTPRDTNSYTSV